MGADSTRDRDLRLTPRHVRRGHGGQAHDDEEHGRSDGHAVGSAGRAPGREGLHGSRARDRRQGRNRPLPRTRVETRRADRGSRRVVAHRALRHEGVPDGGAHPHADLSRARHRDRERPVPGRCGYGSNWLDSPLGGHPCGPLQV